MAPTLSNTSDEGGRIQDAFTANMDAIKEQMDAVNKSLSTLPQVSTPLFSSVKELNECLPKKKIHGEVSAMPTKFEDHSPTSIVWRPVQMKVAQEKSSNHSMQFGVCVSYELMELSTTVATSQMHPAEIYQRSLGLFQVLQKEDEEMKRKEEYMDLLLVDRLSFSRISRRLRTSSTMQLHKAWETRAQETLKEHGKTITQESLDHIGSHDVLLRSFLVQHLEVTDHGWSIAIMPGFVSFRKQKNLEKMRPETKDYKAKHIQLIRETLGIEPTECH